jgi:hypothetical protein
MVCWRFLEIAKLPQIDVLLRYCFSQMFRRFTRVAAQPKHQRDETAEYLYVRRSPSIGLPDGLELLPIGG